MEHTERRKEARYPIEANALIHKHSGEVILAMATNISSAGMLLHIEQPAKLTVDEPVTVDVKLIGYPDQPFSSWGMARIAHIDDAYFGIQLVAGLFDAEAPIVLSEQLSGEAQPGPAGNRTLEDTST